MLKNSSYLHSNKVHTYLYYNVLSAISKREGWKWSNTVTDETKTKAWFSLSPTLSMGEVSCLYVYISNGQLVMNESIKNVCIFFQIQILSLESRLQYILTIPKTSRYEYLKNTL